MGICNFKDGCSKLALEWAYKSHPTPCVGIIKMSPSGGLQGVNTTSCGRSGSNIGAIFQVECGHIRVILGRWGGVGAAAKFRRRPNFVQNLHLRPG